MITTRISISVKPGGAFRRAVICTLNLRRGLSGARSAALTGLASDGRFNAAIPMEAKRRKWQRSRLTRPARRRVRVLVADDHLVFLEGIQALLTARGLEVVAQAVNGADAVRLAHERRPDVAVLDVVMPVLGGVDAAREIAAAAPGMGLILLSGLTEERMVRDALRVGVRGFVVKTQAAEDLVQAIREVSRGGMYVSPGAALPETLSPREREVLRFVAEGKTTKQMAALLGVSVRTVDTHRASIMRRLGIHDTAGLVRYAIRQGLIV